MNPSTAFYGDLSPVTSFSALTDGDRFCPLPEDWVIGVADIVGSTNEIANGRYKIVNMIGAAVIASHVNTLGTQAFPFAFGGDGAIIACGPDQASASARALAILRQWAAEEFGISLRAAQVPVSEIRNARHDVAVARYCASPGVDYAMFSGGGITWAEAQMKAGRFAIAPASSGSQPDLTGLSCRWSNARARNGSILSVVVQQLPGASPAGFSRLASQILAVADRLDRAGHPLPRGGTDVRWPPPGLTIEAHASRRGKPLLWRQIQLLAENLLAWAIFRSGLKVGGFDPVAYSDEVVHNTDFRKFDDGLKMTLDCDASSVRQIRALLEQARSEGIADYGLFEQAEAMITCFVPSVTRKDHIHLVDGASGGYAQAAAQLKPVPS